MVRCLWKTDREVIPEQKLLWKLSLLSKAEEEESCRADGSECISRHGNDPVEVKTGEHLGVRAARAALLGGSATWCQECFINTFKTSPPVALSHGNPPTENNLLSVCRLMSGHVSHAPLVACRGFEKLFMCKLDLLFMLRNC